MTDSANSPPSTHDVQCPLCGTRITVLSDDLGKPAECPDCHHLFEVTQREIVTAPPTSAPANTSDEEDDYGLKSSDDDPDAARKQLGQSLYAQAEKELQEQAQRQDLHKRTPPAFEPRPKYEIEDEDRRPRESLTPQDYDPRSQRIKFPLNFSAAQLTSDAKLLSDVGLLMRWVFLSLFVAMTLYFSTLAIYYANVVPPNFASYFFSLMLTIVSVVVGAATLAYLGSYFLFLVMSVSSGIDEWDWPELGIFDRLTETIFLVAALFLTSVPFGILYSVDAILGLAALSLTFLLFPLVYLSMLDQASPVIPWSTIIFASLARIPGKWFLFYAATFALLLVVGLIGWVVYRLAGFDQLAYIALPGGVLLVGYTLVYALWLGRLGWEISETTPADDEDDKG